STAFVNETVTVNPKAPTVTWGASTPGTEGTAITLGTLADAANSLTGDSNSIQSLVVSGIPVRDTLSDGAGGHSFTVTVGTTSIDVKTWTLSSLTVTTTNDVNFTSTATPLPYTTLCRSSTAFVNETVTVNPKAPTVTWGT